MIRKEFHSDIGVGGVVCVGGCGSGVAASCGQQEEDLQKK